MDAEARFSLYSSIAISCSSLLLHTPTTHQCPHIWSLHIIEDTEFSELTDAKAALHICTFYGSGPSEGGLIGWVVSIVLVLWRQLSVKRRKHCEYAHRALVGDTFEKRIICSESAED